MVLSLVKKDNHYSLLLVCGIPLGGPGAEVAAIGRIASKHVKVAVSQKSSNASRELPVTCDTPTLALQYNMMNNHDIHAEEAAEITDTQHPDVEEMEMDTREGKCRSDTRAHTATVVVLC